MLVKICKPSGHIIKLDHDDWVRIKDNYTYIDDKKTSIYAVLKAKGHRSWGSYLHREITGAKKGQYVDHINHDGLDCRKTNLRICSNRENIRNRRISKNNTTGYKGVSFEKRRNCYVAQISIMRKHIHLGQFSNPIDAAKAYDLGAKKYFGEFCKTNF